MKELVMYNSDRSHTQVHTFLGGLMRTVINNVHLLPGIIEFVKKIFSKKHEVKKDRVSTYCFLGRTYQHAIMPEDVINTPV